MLGSLCILLDAASRAFNSRIMQAGRCIAMRTLYLTSIRISEAHPVSACLHTCVSEASRASCWSLLTLHPSKTDQNQSGIVTREGGRTPDLPLRKRMLYPLSYTRIHTCAHNCAICTYVSENGDDRDHIVFIVPSCSLCQIMYSSSLLGWHRLYLSST
jgi:hypothetical protein